MTMWDDLADEDAQRLERVRAEIAAEKAAWDALTPEQQAAHTAQVEAKFALGDVEDEPCDTCGLPSGDPDCECGFDATDMEDEE